MNTLRRDYIDGADLSSAVAVLAQLDAWIADYNHEAPHSDLGYLTPDEYRQKIGTLSVTACLRNRGSEQGQSAACAAFD